MKLLDAVRAGDISVVKYLLKDGADVNAKNEDGHTVLMSAVENGYKNYYPMCGTSSLNWGL